LSKFAEVNLDSHKTCKPFSISAVPFTSKFCFASKLFSTSNLQPIRTSSSKSVSHHTDKLSLSIKSPLTDKPSLAYIRPFDSIDNVFKSHSIVVRDHSQSSIQSE